MSCCNSRSTPEDTIRVLCIEPNKEPYEIEIENSLEVMQSFVGGYITTIGYGVDTVLIVNEEGRLLNLPENRNFPGLLSYQKIVGTFLICGVDYDYNFSSLSENQISFWKWYYKL